MSYTLIKCITFVLDNITACLMKVWNRIESQVNGNFVHNSTTLLEGKVFRKGSRELVGIWLWNIYTEHFIGKGLFL